MPAFPTGPGDHALPPDELAALRLFLDRQRALVAWKLADCPAEVLQSVSSPTGMTALGLVRHLTEVETSWWYDDVLGRDAPHPSRPGDATTGSTDEVLAAYAAACRACDAAVAGLELSTPGAGTPTVNVRWVYLHLVEETARHLGHLDLLRELADGSTGDGPD